jgi:hypothetical protein
MNPAIPHIYMVATPAGGVWQSAQVPNRLIAHKLLGISKSHGDFLLRVGDRIRMADGGGATGIGRIVSRRRQID